MKIEGIRRHVGKVGTYYWVKLNTVKYEIPVTLPDDGIPQFYLFGKGIPLSDMKEASDLINNVFKNM